jgi:hypothetical protein
MATAVSGCWSRSGIVRPALLFGGPSREVEGDTRFRRGPRWVNGVLVVKAYDPAMADSYPCPRCSQDVPTHGVWSGPAQVGRVGEATQQHAECPRCKARLYRARNIPDQSWRLDPRSEQPPWND